MRARLVLASVIVASTLDAIALAGDCSLGLDPNKIPDADASFEGGSDAGTDAPNPVACKADPDCKSSNGCLSGTCDTVRGQCVYTLCKTTASCNVSVCDEGSHTCSAPKVLPFHAGSFHVSIGAAGCNGNNPGGGPGARRCLAAVYPYVFFGTTNGVVAYPVDDPTATAPPAIPVGGLPFLPSFIVASGSTVYFVGSVQGAGPTYKLPIASLTVPTDPTLSELTANTVFDTVNEPSVELVVPDASGGIYLVHHDAVNSDPEKLVTAPLKDLDIVTFTSTSGLPANSTVSAASGTRLVTFRPQNGGAYDTFFSLETNAAAGAPQPTSEQSTLPTMAQTYQNHYLAQTPTGGLLWSTESVIVPNDGGAAQTMSARVAWVLADGDAGTFDASAHVDVASYGLPGLPTPDLSGPLAWLDPNDMVVISALPTNTAQSQVLVATRNGTPAVVPSRSYTLPFHPSELAVTTSNGFAYVATPDQTNPTTAANIHVFGATCNN
ncbi:MAG TPA: hypothetical protein VGH28_14350 [Polyangiaceae bacterium]